MRPVALRRRAGAFAISLTAAFAVVVGQLIHLALQAEDGPTSHVARALERSWARPDIVDRKGRLLATDIATPSLFADPSVVSDEDEIVLALTELIQDLDEKSLRDRLADKSRRFAWVRRGLQPRTAQAIHNLGIPGLGFRRELRRVYPAGTTASHVIGTVNVDNRGQFAIERYIDRAIGVEAIDGPQRSSRAPVRLSIDLGAQHALREELADAISRYRAEAASAVILNVQTGEVMAAASLPDFNPNRGGADLDVSRIDRLTDARYELGSVFKVLTLAAVLDAGLADLDSEFDAREPIRIGGHTIDDSHPERRIMTAREVFIRSSNIGTARMAERLGGPGLEAFFARLGLLEPMQTEIGRLTRPEPPERWGRVQTMTASFGHGIAVAPLQFAAAAAALVNGGRRVYPTFLAQRAERVRHEPARVIKPETSAAIRRMMRLNVASSRGTGGRADVEGYEVGGKTGTADIPGPGGYGRHGVNSSFLAIMPTRAPRLLALVTIHKPQPTPQSGNSVSAGRTAAPTTARIIRRIGPILGITARQPRS